jgi:hypothetical protein
LVKKGVVARTFKKIGIDIPDEILSKWTFLDTIERNEQEKSLDPLREYYAMSTIERLYSGLFYISKVAHLYTEKHFSGSPDVNTDNLATSVVYNILTILARKSVNIWIGLRLKRSDVQWVNTSFERERSFLSFVFSQFKDNLPIGIIEKFNVK